MSCICLDTNWFLKGLESPCPPDWTALSALFSEDSDAFSLPRFPMQVHDVLLAYGIIENPNIRGVNRDLWIHERDWVYCCRFSAQANVPSLLTFDGVDTFADVWLNGTLLGSCSDVYLSWEYDVGHLLRTENTLIVYFHAAQTELKKLSLPERYAGLVPTISAARVFRTGYHDYCGPSPCLIRCGLYAPVTLRQAEPVALAEITCDTWLTEDGDGVVQLQLTWVGQADTPYAVSLADAHGTVVADASGTTAHGRQRLSLSVHQPERWYPWTHGTPTCYTLTVRAENEDVSRLVGFRQIDISDRLLFRVNGMPVRMWGANLMHLDTLTNCYAPEKMARILDLAQLANCNMLRVWGEALSQPILAALPCATNTYSPIPAPMISIATRRLPVFLMLSTSSTIINLLPTNFSLFLVENKLPTTFPIIIITLHRIYELKAGLCLKNTVRTLLKYDCR